MNRTNIFIEALYEFKCSLRSILFSIFVVVVIAGLIVYQFLPLSEMNSVSSINTLFQTSRDWVSIALPSSIAYKTAYCFNMIQLFFVVVFVVNSSRSAKLRAMESIHARPQNNSEIVIGSFLGKLLFFTMVNGIVFAISMLINAIFFSHSFAWTTYFFYWLTLTFPTLVYLLGISYLVTRFISHQGFSMLILLAFLGGIIYWGADWLNGLPDPFGRYIPNMFSDFTGHVNPENYLLQRGFTLLTGIGLLTLSVIPYPRIPNHLDIVKKSLSFAGVTFILAGVMALFYHSGHKTVSDKRENYKRAYEEHGKHSAARIIRNDLHLKELENGNIAVNSHITVTNRATGVIPLVMYLNPGLNVNSLEINGKIASFRKDNQVLLTDKELAPGEYAEVLIDYEGKIENDICFLETASGKYNSPTVNRFGIYHFGYSPAFCEKGYKLLTPECIWYPVCASPYEKSGIKDVNFSRYTLKVEHDPRLVAISQGNSTREREGETVFMFDHDMPGISLCMGDYKKREITVDSTRLSLYYLPGHDYLLKEYDFPEEGLVARLEQRKGTHLEINECIQTSDFWKKKFMEKNIYDPIQQYPYRWLVLLEVPCNFYCFPGQIQPTGERVQGGIAFIPEKAYPLKKYPVAPLPESVATKEMSLFYQMDKEIKMIIEEGGCDIKPTFRGKTTYISSQEYPMLHDVLTNVAHGEDNPMTASPAEDFPAVEYLTHNSLNDALQDQSLSPELLARIVYKKSQELHAYITLQVGNERFRQFYIDFLKSTIFKETNAETCFQQFYETFGFRLDSLVKDWYTTNHLPLLEIREARLFKIMDGDEPYKLYCFKVFNRSDVPCLLMTDDKQGWTIPPREGKEIRARGRKEEDPECATNGFVTIPLAQNLPGIMDLDMQEMEYRSIDTTTGVFSIDSSDFVPNKEEIIVDNEDPGFKVVKAKDVISFLFKEEKNRKEYREYSTEDNWFTVIGQQFYGSPVRSAHWKRVGSGKQKVEWSVSLPQEGKYEVFFYYARRFTGIGINQSEENPRYYTVFDGKEEHEVAVTCRENEAGVWMSLGVFDFLKTAKVTLSDRGRIGDNVPILVADAVKWVKMKE